MKVLIYLCMAVTIITSPSCLEVLEWEEEVATSQTLVVEGLITTELGPHSVQLSRTRQVIEEGPGEAVSGALVTISDGHQVFALRENTAGVYETEAYVRGEVGETYTLSIEIGQETFSASSKIELGEPLPPIEIRPWERGSLSADTFQYFEMSYRPNFGAPKPYSYEVNLTIPENVSDYYPTSWIMPDWVERRLASNDLTLIDSSYYLHASLEPPALFAYGESIHAGLPYGTKVTEKFYSMTGEHAEFVRSVLSETDWRGLGPFGYIPADIPTNISNGALGWFAASDVAVSEYRVSGSSP